MDETGLILTSDIVIQCESYKEIIFIDKDDVVEFDKHSGERPMGAEITYTFFGDKQCDKCENEIEYKIIASEYPVGAVEHIYTECKGWSQDIEKNGVEDRIIAK